MFTIQQARNFHDKAKSAEQDTFYYGKVPGWSSKWNAKCDEYKNKVSELEKIFDYDKKTDSIEHLKILADRAYAIVHAVWEFFDIGCRSYAQKKYIELLEEYLRYVKLNFESEEQLTSDNLLLEDRNKALEGQLAIEKAALAKEKNKKDEYKSALQEVQKLLITADMDEEPKIAALNIISAALQHQFEAKPTPALQSAPQVNGSNARAARKQKQITGAGDNPNSLLAAPKNTPQTSNAATPSSGAPVNSQQTPAKK